MSKFLLFSKIVSVRSLFLQMFCKKMLRDFRIIIFLHSQLSKSSQLLCFLAISFSIELILPKQIVSTISLMVFFTVNVFECVSTRFSFQSFNVRIVNLGFNIFLIFFYFYLFFLLFFLLLLIDDKEACDCSHMTYHMR